MSPAPEAPFPDRLVLFDGHCNLCNGWVRFLLRHDDKDRFIFAALRSAAGARFVRTHASHLAGTDTIIYWKAGRALTRSTAALSIFRDLGAPYALTYVLILVPRFFRDACYDLLARNRYRWFGQQQHCPLPDPRHLAKFLRQNVDPSEPNA